MDNVITAFFNCSRRAVTNAAWKGDRGMVLRFAGVELPPVYEVHFSHSRAEAAKIVLGNDDGVEIPDEYFSGSRIYAWIYLTPETDVGYTVYEVEIPLQQRPATTDVQPTPEEESIIDQAISALNNAVEVSTEAAETAVEAAESVSETAYKMDTFEADFNGEIFVGTTAQTKRVDGGTLLLNPIKVTKLCAQVGYVWEEAGSELHVYFIFSSPASMGNRGSVKTYILYEKDSESEPHELTLENTETRITPSGAESNNCKWHVEFDDVDSHIDVRGLRVMYDADGNEIDRIYSAQYRYEIDGGTVTQTPLQTPVGDASHIIAVGLIRPTTSVGKTFSYKTYNSGGLLIPTGLYPLVSTVQSSKFNYIIPDSFFEGATYGLAFCTVAGDGARFLGPTFDKAEDTGPFVVNLTPTEPDFSGTMDKTGDDILQAYLSGQRIRFVVQGLSAGADATMFNLLDDGAGGIAGVIANAFVVYDAGSGWMNILISSGAYDNTYTTTIFQLTPIT